jgi:threonylcarbamoyladenosine tRNA methylthiotransferase MtaB
VRQARQAIRRAARAHPGAPIIVTGCAAQLAPETFRRMPEVARVVGNAEKLRGPALTGAEGDLVVGDVMALNETAPHLIDGFEGRARAFVQIQQGCDHRCTFCIIPFARGPSRSVAVPRIVEQVRRLVDSGFREVVLTGVDICSWGRDLAGRPRLGDAVRSLLAQVPDLPQLRLSTLDPAAIDETLFQVLADEPRLMPHLHFSLQAADDLVLKRMKRRHCRADAAAVIARARAARPDVVLGGDLIAGFPTETDAMAANTLRAVDEWQLTWLHVFPYSPRAGTPAARMPQVPGPVRRARAAALRAAGAANQQRTFASRAGTVCRVLVETEDRGRCPDYAPVRLPPKIAAPGMLADIRIIGHDGGGLIGAQIGEAAA